MKIVCVVCSEDGDSVSVVSECWRIRVKWWPQYHLVPLVSSADVSSVYCYKAAIAVLLLGPGTLNCSLVYSIIGNNCLKFNRC